MQSRLIWIKGMSFWDVITLLFKYKLG